jgi:magnesium chelatase subunit I
VIPQLKDRIGSLIRTHYPEDRQSGIDIMVQESGIDLGGDYPVLVPPFMLEIIEEISRLARKSKYIDQLSGVSARFSIANYKIMVASARNRGIRLGEKPAVPRICDLAHLKASSLGKLELDLMGSHQMSEAQVLEAIIAEAVARVFKEYVEENGLDEIGKVFSKGLKIEVGDLLPSATYAQRMTRVPQAWDKAFEVNASTSEAVRASCMEFVLAGLYATDRISRSEKHGRIEYETK